MCFGRRGESRDLDFVGRTIGRFGIGLTRRKDLCTGVIERVGSGHSKSVRQESRTARAVLLETINQSTEGKKDNSRRKAI